MKRKVLVIGGVLLLLIGLMMLVFVNYRSRGEMLSPKGEEVVEVEKPYKKYDFESLAKRGGVKSEIEVQGKMFYYDSEGKRISGEIIEPEGEAKGIVVMARGYVDKEIYYTGLGTHNAASYYSAHGYRTYAPDFLGYGESDSEDENSLGARVVKPVAMLDLLASLPNDLPIYLWGHSNGGQIVLSIAEIIGEGGQFPNVKGAILWAPVSRPFPYSILYYTYDWDDGGEELRRVLAEWEKDYKASDYSIDKYLDWIRIPIILHQGTADEAVPVSWSDDLVSELKRLEKEVVYYRYPGADHNMRLQPTATQSGGQASWETVVRRDLSWLEQ